MIQDFFNAPNFQSFVTDLEKVVLNLDTTKPKKFYRIKFNGTFVKFKEKHSWKSLGTAKNMCYYIIKEALRGGPYNNSGVNTLFGNYKLERYIESDQYGRKKYKDFGKLLVKELFSKGLMEIVEVLDGQ